jgi:hypothetical protein
MNWLPKWWPVLVGTAFAIVVGTGYGIHAQEAHQKAHHCFSFIENQKNCKDLCDELDRDGVLEISYAECVRRCERSKDEED